MTSSEPACDSVCIQQDRELTKLARWLVKLERPEAVKAYNLTDARELAMVCRKYLGMTSTLRRVIDEEWIEEWPQKDDGEDCASQDDDEDDDEGEEDNGRGWSLPPCGDGWQRPLSSSFPLVTLTSSSEKEKSEAAVERQCFHCQSSIWNRGWQCKESLASCETVQAGHALCAACFASGVRCATANHRVVMVERYKMKFLLETFHKAAQTFNRLLLPLCRQNLGPNFLPELLQHLNLKLDASSKDTTGVSIDDDLLCHHPQPAGGRSCMTVSYHLYQRHHLPMIFCHQCKSRRYPAELITCDDKDHRRSMNHGGTVRSRNGFYYCNRCLINRYGEQALDAFKTRGWQCYVCRKMCNCAACRSQAGSSHAGSTALTPASHSFTTATTTPVAAHAINASNSHVSQEHKSLKRAAASRKRRRKQAEEQRELEDEEDQEDQEDPEEEDREERSTMKKESKRRSLSRKSNPPVPTSDLSVRSTVGSRSPSASASELPASLLSMLQTYWEGNASVGWTLSLGQFIYDLQHEVKRLREENERLRRQVVPATGSTLVQVQSVLAGLVPALTECIHLASGGQEQQQKREQKMEEEDMCRNGAGERQQPGH